MLGYVLGILFIVLAIFGFLSEHIPFLYNRIPRKCRNTLRKDAKIIDFKQLGHRHKVGTNIETSVVFDDGFIYVSHKSQSTFNGVKTTPQINEEILDDAYKAHLNAIYKYGSVD